MIIRINDKSRDSLPTREERRISVSAAAGEVEGEVTSAQEATATLMRTARWFFSAMLVLVGALLVAIGFAAAYELLPSERLPALLFAVLAAAVCVALMRWSYLRTMKRWNGRLAERVSAIAPVGTRIRLDDLGLTIGDAVASWADLSLAGVDMAKVSSDDDWGFILERMTIVGGAAPIALDRNLMRGGAAILDTAYRRLIRDRGIVEL